MYKRKRSGPSTEPCGTPMPSITLCCDVLLLCETKNVRLCRYDVMRSSAIPLMPYNESL